MADYALINLQNAVSYLRILCMDADRRATYGSAFHVGGNVDDWLIGQIEKSLAMCPDFAVCGYGQIDERWISMLQRILSLKESVKCQTNVSDVSELERLEYVAAVVELVASTEQPVGIAQALVQELAQSVQALDALSIRAICLSAQKMLNADDAYWEALSAPPYNELKPGGFVSLANLASDAWRAYCATLELHGIPLSDPRGLAMYLLAL